MLRMVWLRLLYSVGLIPYRHAYDVIVPLVKENERLTGISSFPFRDFRVALELREQNRLN